MNKKITFTRGISFVTRSVNSRYSENSSTPCYAFSPCALPSEPIVIAKQIACYGYQSCENDDYEATEAFALVELMEKEVKVMIADSHPEVNFNTATWGGNLEDEHSYRSTPAWTKAPWGIDGDTELEVKAPDPSEQLRSSLAQFTGTERYHRHGFMRNFYHTDGIQYLAEQAKAFWLVDAIVSHFTKRKVRSEPFRVWTLLKVKDRKATLKCTDGDKGGGPITLCRQSIPYTDFPLPEITIYVEYGSVDGTNPAWVAMLPSER